MIKIAGIEVDKSELKKSAIVLVVFGSTVSKTIHTYENIKSSFIKAFPDVPIFIAYTSEFIIKKSIAAGKYIYNVKETVDNLINHGFSSIILQSLHIMPGEEYMSINAHDSSAKIIVGEPLLSSDEDIFEVVKIIESLCDKNGPTVIAAHGNSKYPELNKPLVRLADQIENRCPNTVLCTVEGMPGLEPLKKILNIAKNQDHATFIPLFLVAGMHVEEDLTGTDPSSWKKILGISDVQIKKSMGELQSIHAIYINHCKRAFQLLFESGSSRNTKAILQ